MEKIDIWSAALSAALQRLLSSLPFSLGDARVASRVRCGAARVARLGGSPHIVKIMQIEQPFCAHGRCCVDVQEDEYSNGLRHLRKGVDRVICLRGR